MLQQTFHRRSLKPGMVSAVLFCSLCVGLIPAGCGQRAGTGMAPTAAVGATAPEATVAPEATAVAVGAVAPEVTASAVDAVAPETTAAPPGQVSATILPEALAQTATARPVMIEVNRALLQATIIDATSMAMRSGSAVSPATATAFQAQYEGNIATIEALRPTADSLHIVLVQGAVEPTDAPEATLFAQADEASRAASRSSVGTPTPIVPTPNLTQTPMQLPVVATP